MSRPHVPVLAAELIDLTAPSAGDIVIDCTFGAGGHATLVGERIGDAGTLICVDRDPEAEDRFDALAGELPEGSRFIRSNFADALAALAREGLRADLIYIDLGVSSLQVDSLERGFSYSNDAPLDMRMDPAQDLDAREVVNEWDERRLVQVFRRYGEERFATKIAREIVARREEGAFERTLELVEAIKAAVPTPARFAGGHPAKRVFQAIRIVVNDELAALDRALPTAWSLLGEGGRLGVIAFHSLEDRRVKRYLGGLARGCVCPPEFPMCVCGHVPEADLLPRRGTVPTPGELAENPRSRSARLRVARKLPSGSSPAAGSPVSEGGRP